MISMKLSEICSVIGAEYDGEDKEINGISTDSRAVGENELFIPIVGEKYDAHEFLNGISCCAASLCERDCGRTSFSLIRVKSTVEALGKIAAHNLKKAGVKLCVSLTGSVGKTTTKEMCALVVSQKYNTFKTEGNLNNHIGVPKTLLSLDESHEALVCEMGMSNRGEIAYLTRLVESDVAIITNIGNSHIENLKTRENIAAAKLEILEGLKKDGTLIVNGDEPLLENLNITQRIIRFGFSEQCEVRAENINTHPDGVDFDCICFGKACHAFIPVPGRHNVANALCAVAAGAAVGIDVETACNSLANYVPSGMRQKIYSKNGTTVIADCYNAGIESMTASIRMLSELSCKGRRIESMCASLEALRDMQGDRVSVAVLGDMLELGEVSELFHQRVGEKAVECGINAVFTYGNRARIISETALKNGISQAVHFETREELVEKLSEYSRRENSVILFKASRGMEFEKLISMSGLTQD